MQIKGVEINITGRCIARFYLTLLSRHTLDFKFMSDEDLRLKLRISITPCYKAWCVVNLKPMLIYYMHVSPQY